MVGVLRKLQTEKYRYQTGCNIFNTGIDSLCSETQKLCLHAWPKMKFPATTEFAGLKKDSRHLRPDTKSAKQVNIKSYFYL